MLKQVLLALVVTSVTGCGCTGDKVKRPYPTPTVESLLARIGKARTDARSYKTESVMDYWVGKSRVKGTVYVMGKVGSFIRFNALSPTGGSVAADLGCDGINFKLVDNHNSCQLSGVCDARSIASLLRVELEPDDFLLLAVGATPIIEGAKGTLAWDANRGQEVLTLTGDGGLRQTIKLDGREGRMDVVFSEVRTKDGAVQWRLQNKGFKKVLDKQGKALRVPGKTRFEQPTRKADLIVKWKSRELNLPLGPEMFQVELPGLPRCGG